MESNLQEAFSFAGHDARIFDIYDLKRFSIGGISTFTHTVDKLFRTYSDRYDCRLFRKLFSFVKEFSPDLVICVYRFIHPSFVDLCKSQGAKVIHINPDQMTTLEYQQVFASNYDVWFVKDPYMQRFMRDNMHLNVKLYNEAFNVRTHKKPAEPSLLGSAGFLCVQRCASRTARPAKLALYGNGGRRKTRLAEKPAAFTATNAALFGSFSGSEKERPRPFSPLDYSSQALLRSALTTLRRATSASAR